MFCTAGLQVSVVGLERALHQYTLAPSTTQFDMKTVPLATQPITEQRATSGKDAGEMVTAKPTEKNASSRQDVYAGMI